MKIAKLRGQCPGRKTCPNVFATDRGTNVVQGYTSAELGSRAGEAVVEIPMSLVPEAVPPRHEDLLLTDRGTMLVRGRRVTDSEALADLRLPAGEDAVEVAAGVLQIGEAIR